MTGFFDQWRDGIVDTFRSTKDYSVSNYSGMNNIELHALCKSGLVFRFLLYGRNFRYVDAVGICFFQGLDGFVQQVLHQ